MDLFLLKSLNLDVMSLLKGKRFTVPLSQAFKYSLNLDKKNDTGRGKHVLPFYFRTIYEL